MVRKARTSRRSSNGPVLVGLQEEHALRHGNAAGPTVGRGMPNALPDGLARGVTWTRGYHGESDTADRLVGVPRDAGRIDERTCRFPIFVPAMAGLTALYLVFDLAFQAQLLDLGPDAAASQIEGAAVTCRLLSGVGLTLAFWGLALPWAHKRGISYRSITAGLTLIAMLALAGAQVGGTRAVRQIISATDSTTWRAAAQLHVLTSAMRDRTVALEGLDLSPDLLARPEGKTLLALFPTMGLAAGELEARSSSIMLAVFHHRAERRIGTAANSYDASFIPSVRMLRDAYNNYVGMHRHLVESIQGIPARSTQAWADYLATLADEDARPSLLPKNRWPEIAARVRIRGIPVPDGWNPVDRAGFLAAATKHGREVADGAFAAETQARFGVRLPPGLAWKEFAASPVIQARWRTVLGAPEDVALTPDMGFDTYAATVYRPMLEQAILAQAGPLLSPATAFAPGGPGASFGQDGITRLVLLPLILAVSLIGLLFHLTRLADYLLQMTLPRLQRRLTTACILVGALAIAVCFGPNALSQSDTFATYEANLIRRGGFLPALATRWAIQAEPYLYPVGDTLRVLTPFGALHPSALEPAHGDATF